MYLVNAAKAINILETIKYFLFELLMPSIQKTIDHIQSDTMNISTINVVAETKKAGLQINAKDAPKVFVLYNETSRYVPSTNSNMGSKNAVCRANSLHPNKSAISAI